VGTEAKVAQKRKEITQQTLPRWSSHASWVEKTANVVLKDGRFEATLRACRTLAMPIGLGYFVVVSSFA
jgi:hypothetical protein